MRTHRRLSWPLLGALFAALLVATPAFAAPGARCGLTAIEASNDGKGIDAQLSEIKELTEPPLSTTYARFKFLGQADSDLGSGLTKELTPSKLHPAKLTFNGEDAKSKKLLLKVELPSLKFSADLKLKSGANFMIATKSGTLIAVKCNKVDLP